MSFPDPYPSHPEPDTFSLPVTPEEVAQWAQVAGDVQPELVDAINFDFESLDALFTWEQSGTLPKPTPESQLGGGLDLDWTAIVAGGMPALDSDYFAAVPAPPPLANNIYYQDLLGSPEWDLLPLTPALTDVSSVPSPQSDNTGDQLHLPPSWCTGDNFNFMGQPQPDYAAIAGMSGSSWYSPPLNYTEANLNMVGPIDSLTTMRTTTTEVAGTSVLGKRTRESRESAETSGALEATGSTKRTRPTPATKTQFQNNGKSKAVGRGAGRLASTTARGVYRRSLLGPSVPQGSVGALAQGQLPWTEEREQEEMRDDIMMGSSTLPRPEIAEDMEAIPTTLTAWQRLLLETTEADVERGAVSMIKCRLCPTERFKTWACFCRHCRDCEEHPVQIKCCERCGIYFGRQDSMKRHKDSATKACCATTPAEAAWRKHRAEQLLADFQARVEDCLRTGEELGRKFAAIAREELPSKSKKVFLSKKTKSKGDNSQN